MKAETILSKVDYTLLTQTASWEDIKKLCDEAIAHHTASVCIPPCFVRDAKAYVSDRMKICTVIGFPNGYATTAVKVFETEDALKAGADEIDMVVNINWVKEGLFDQVEEEIRSIKKACGSHILKVIIETCFLTEAEKKAMCRAVTRAGADYIKTSTGFAGGGATFEDVALMAANVGPSVRVKAAGGIASMADAERFLELGASRLGTSRVVRLVKEGENEGK